MFKFDRFDIHTEPALLGFPIDEKGMIDNHPVQALPFVQDDSYPLPEGTFRAGC